MNTTKLIPMEDWDACDLGRDLGRDLGSMIARKCWGGIDVSSTQGMAAWVLLFEPEHEGGPWSIFPRFFCPRSAATSSQFIGWEKQGYLLVTEGDTVDYDVIALQIINDCRNFVVECAGDPWNLGPLQQSLLRYSDIEIIEYRSTMANVGAATKRLLAMIAARTIAHGGNPILAWMARGCAVTEDTLGNIRFSKKDSDARVEGLIATVIALGISMNARFSSCV